MKKKGNSHPNQILHLTGIHLANGIIAGLKQIERKKRYLNKINLFPIPDKDTGTNLFQTLNPVGVRLAGFDESSVSLTSSLISQTALAAAQGYSGTILAHFLQGFSRASSGRDTLSAIEFASACGQASLSARDAISDPRDGTMISVMQDWSAMISDKSRSIANLSELLDESLTFACRSLADTRNIIPVLKNSGVVDAGAQGFVYLVEGLLNSLKDKTGEKKYLKHSSRKGKTAGTPEREMKVIETTSGSGRIGIVTDSSCDLPDHFLNENQIHVIPLKISFGNRTYLDKIQISPSEFYRKLVRSSQHPKTSQPAAGDVRELIDRLVPRYKHILCIHLPRVVSGTLQVVETAVKPYREKVTCIDGRNISAALGLVIMEAVKIIKKYDSLDIIHRQIQQAIDNIKIFIVLPTVKYLVKGGRLSKSKGLIGRLFHFNPIVTFNKEGSIQLLAKAIGNRQALQKALDMVYAAVKPYKHMTFMVAHANAPQKARWVAEQLKNRFQIDGTVEIVEAAPVLGVHAGPGTVGCGFIGFRNN